MRTVTAVLLGGRLVGQRLGGLRRHLVVSRLAA